MQQMGAMQQMGMQMGGAGGMQMAQTGAEEMSPADARKQYLAQLTSTVNSLSEEQEGQIEQMLG